MIHWIKIPIFREAQSGFHKKPENGKGKENKITNQDKMLENSKVCMKQTLKDKESQIMPLGEH